MEWGQHQAAYESELRKVCQAARQSSHAEYGAFVGEGGGNQQKQVKKGKGSLGLW